MLRLDTLTHVDSDATSIYDISSMPYDVDHSDPYDDALIVHDDDRLDPDGTSIIDIRGMAYDVDCGDLEATSIYARVYSRAAEPLQIRTLRHEIAGLRAALASGWEVGPELAYEERRLALLEAAAINARKGAHGITRAEAEEIALAD